MYGRTLEIDFFRNEGVNALEKGFDHLHNASLERSLLTLLIVYIFLHQHTALHREGIN